MPRRALLRLTVSALVLLVLICVLLGVGRLLDALGDAAAASVINYAALAAAVLLAVDIILLVLLQSCILLGVADDPPDELER